MQIPPLTISKPLDKSLNLYMPQQFLNIREPKFICWLYYLLSVWPSVSYFHFLVLRFLICKLAKLIQKMSEIPPRSEFVPLERFWWFQSMTSKIGCNPDLMEGVSPTNQIIDPSHISSPATCHKQRYNYNSINVENTEVFSCHITFDSF